MYQTWAKGSGRRVGVLDRAQVLAWRELREVMISGSYVGCVHVKVFIEAVQPGPVFCSVRLVGQGKCDFMYQYAVSMVLFVRTMIAIHQSYSRAFPESCGLQLELTGIIMPQPRPRF